MNLTIEAAELRRAVLTAAAGAEGRVGTIPILGSLLFEAGPGPRFRVSGTDMDLTIRAAGEARHVAASGSCCPPAHELAGIAKALPAGGQAELRYEPEAARLHVTCGRSKWRLACLPVDEFPAFTEPAPSATFAIDSADLRRLLDRTSWSVSTEETRHYLNGVYLHVVQPSDTEDGRGPLLVAVSTDGHRLTRADMPVPAGAETMPEPGPIVPRRTVAALQRLLDAKAPETVAIAVSETKLRFDVGAVTLASKVVDGAFPDYSRVIPRRGNSVVHVEAQALAEALQRIQPVTADKSRAVRLTAAPGEIVVETSQRDGAHAGEDAVPAELEGDGREVGFNGSYLLGALGLFAGKVAWHWDDAVAPARFEDPDDPSLVVVVMPMRV